MEKWKNIKIIITFKLKFEGEYLFKEKIKGKLFDCDGKIIFELNNNNGIIKENSETIRVYIGDNLNEEMIKEGKVKGKEINLNGQIIFEGEYFNKEIWNGIIKEYLYLYDPNKLCNEKEYLNGKIWSGISISGYDDVCEYIFGLENGKRHRYLYRDDKEIEKKFS